MDKINTNGKPVRMPNPMPKSRNYENAVKIIRNEIDFYEKNWPFYNPETTFGKILSMFWNFRFVRKMIGGTWVKGQYHWLKTNKSFDKEWLSTSEHENWD